MKKQTFLQARKPAFIQQLHTLGYSKPTQDHARGALERLDTFLQQTGKIQQHISQKQLDAYFEFLLKRSNQKQGGGLSLSTIHKERSGLKLLVDFLYKTEQHPLLCFPKLERSRSMPPVLTKQQVKQLFSACESSLLGRRNRALLALCYGCGLRRSEALNVKCHDIDYNKQQLLVTRSKTGAQRYVPFSPTVLTWLEEYHREVRLKLLSEDSREDAFLLTDRGKPLSCVTANYLFSQLLKKAQVKKEASLHTLRHSIATHLLENGMPLENIALFLGHKSLDSTQIYTHVLHSLEKNH